MGKKLAIYLVGEGENKIFNGNGEGEGAGVWQGSYPVASLHCRWNWSGGGMGKREKMESKMSRKKREKDA